jgi:putative phosphoesterase
MRGVAGNSDWGSVGKMIDSITVLNKKIVFAHGHTFNVKAGADEFLTTARNLGAHIALYGHTHTALRNYEDGLYIMNPGSVAVPRGGPPTYGMIDITPAGVVTTIVELARVRR